MSTLYEQQQVELLKRKSILGQETQQFISEEMLQNTSLSLPPGATEQLARLANLSGVDTKSLPSILSQSGIVT